MRPSSGRCGSRASAQPSTVLLVMGRDMRAMEPRELLFWGVMSMGVIAGFGMAYSSNVWMVAKGLKHGLMTERTPGGRGDARNKSSDDHGKHRTPGSRKHQMEDAGGHAEDGHM